MEVITIIAGFALGLSWTSAAFARFVASVLVAKSAGVSLLANAGFTRWHSDEDSVGSARGTVVVAVVVAILANVGAFNAFSFTKDKITIA